MPASSQFQPIACYDLAATIPVGQTTSQEIDLAGVGLCGLFLPATFDGATLTIAASPVSGGAFVTVQSGGTDYTLASAASKYCPVENLAVVAGLRFVKLVAGTVQTATDTVVTLATRPV